VGAVVQQTTMERISGTDEFFTAKEEVCIHWW